MKLLDERPKSIYKFVEIAKLHYKKVASLYSLLNYIEEYYQIL